MPARAQRLPLDLRAAVALFALCAFALALSHGPAVSTEGEQQGSAASSAVSKLPLSFVPNRGQVDSPARYYAKAGGASFQFLEDRIAIALTKGEKGHVLHLRFPGADPTATLTARGRRAGTANYLAASESHTNLPTYGELVYRDLWPGIDMAIRGRHGALKYEFLVAPGADPADIRLAYAGSSGLSLEKAGSLSVATPLGALTDQAPRSYQRTAGRRAPVQSSFVLRGERAYGFNLGPHDATRPLVIDPGLVYSTYIGGVGADYAGDVKVDERGRAHVVGGTLGTDFPTTPGAYDTTSSGQSDDVFVLRLNSDGSDLDFSTFLAGGGFDTTETLALGEGGSVYVAGSTDSSDFPTTADAYDRVLGNGSIDGFVAKLSRDGSNLLYSTFLGGDRQDAIYGIDVDDEGAAYVTGYTPGSGFPVTAGAYDQTLQVEEAFVTKLNPLGSALLYSTLLGGDRGEYGVGVEVERDGDAFVTGSTNSSDFPATRGAYDSTLNGGSDLFISELNASGSTLLGSTLVGGSDDDLSVGVGLDREGNPYAAGTTFSPNFPGTPGAFAPSFNGGCCDAFVLQLNPDLSSLVYSTHLGGSDFDAGKGMTVDRAGSAYVVGRTHSSNFPTTPGGHDSSLGGGADAFVTRVSAGGAVLSYGTYLGGDAGADDSFGVSASRSGGAYVSGDTLSSDFPTTTGAYDRTLGGYVDGFVAKLDTNPNPRACKTKGKGKIKAGNGDAATFYGDARSGDDGDVRGQQSYRDLGPSQPFRFSSRSIDALTCEGRKATILGRGRLGDGSTVEFRIELEDRASHGHGDTYRILLSNGYDSGTQRLRSGNVSVR